MPPTVPPAGLGQFATCSPPYPTIFSHEEGDAGEGRGAGGKWGGGGSSIILSEILNLKGTVHEITHTSLAFLFQKLFVYFLCFCVYYMY
jgi:hypothetical protein